MKAGSRNIWLERRLTRRAALRGTGLGLAMLSVGGLTSACGGSTEQQATTGPVVSPTKTGATPAPQAGGTLTYAAGSQLVGLNPHLSLTGSLNTATYCYDRMLNYDPSSGAYELVTAQSVERPDPLTIVFKIHPKAKFHNVAPVNGRSVTSEDVVASWKAFVDNPRAVNNSFFKVFVDHYETPDTGTVVLKLKTPNAWAFTSAAIATAGAVIFPKEMIKDIEADKLVLGSGGYIMDEYDPTSVQAFRKRPDGWHFPPRPYLERIVIRVITDAAARAAAFKSKQIDFLGARDRLEADEFKGYGPDMVIGKDFTRPTRLTMKPTPGAPFENVRVREAVYNALDIKEMIDKADLGDGEYTGPVPSMFANFALPADEVKKAFPHDVAKAKQLLAGAGWDSNREVELSYNTGTSRTELLAEIVKKQLEAVGIRIKLAPTELNTYRTKFGNLDFQLGLDSILQGSSADIFIRLFGSQGTNLGNPFTWTDPEVEALIAQQAKELDAEKQKGIILDLQRQILSKFCPIVMLYSPTVYTGTWGYLHPDNRGQIGSSGGYWWTEKRP